MMTVKIIGESTITASGIDDHRFSMADFIDKFPVDLIGGGNDDKAAKKSALVHWGSSSPEETDIAGDKCIFRRRGFVKVFFANNDAMPGDLVRVEEIAPYEYSLSLIKKAVRP